MQKNRIFRDIIGVFDESENLKFMLYRNIYEGNVFGDGKNKDYTFY